MLLAFFYMSLQNDRLARLLHSLSCHGQGFTQCERCPRFWRFFRAFQDVVVIVDVSNVSYGQNRRNGFDSDE